MIVLIKAYSGHQKESVVLQKRRIQTIEEFEEIARSCKKMDDLLGDFESQIYAYCEEITSCENCNKFFKTKNKNAQYCSTDCNQDAEDNAARFNAPVY